MIHDVISYEYNHGHRDPSFDYSLFFAAADAILDSQEALAPADSDHWPVEVGLRYLWLYGALQALSVLQEGVVQLLKSFSLSAGEFKRDTKSIREKRIMLAGHPAQHESTAIKGATFLVRSRLDGGRFQYGTFINGGGYTRGTVDIVEIIRENSLYVNAALSRAWVSLGGTRQKLSRSFR